jgi:hypothetical protein
MNPLRSLRPAAIALLLLLLAQAASAQIDDRARELLEGLRPPAGEVVDTLDQVMNMTVYQGGAEQAVRTRTVIDFVGERAAIETEMAPGMVATMVMQDGAVSMVIGGMALPLPAEMAGSFDGIFDRSPEDLFAEGATATYDGMQSYGDLVKGEQVTFTGPSLVAGVDDGDASRYLFDEAGRLLAVVVETDEGTLITVFDEPFAGSAVVGRDATMYMLGANGAERFATMSFESVRINEPVDETLFD